MGENGLVPWVPGMRATDEDGDAWRRAASGVWFPDGKLTNKVAPKGALSADFTDMSTGVIVQWIVSQAQAQQAKEDAKTDPTHPLNVLAAIDRAKDVEPDNLTVDDILAGCTPVKIAGVDPTAEGGEDGRED